MKTEFEDIQFRFAVDEAGTFEGYALLYGEKNRHGELYAPGAFRRTLEEHRSIGSRPSMFWNHNHSEVIGTWIEVREDNRGLFMRGQLLLDTIKGREVASMIKAGAVNGLSIGFRKVRDRVAGNVRTLLDVDLVEVSVVPVPSASRARIFNYRNTPKADALSFTEACRRAAKAMRLK